MSYAASVTRLVLVLLAISAVLAAPTSAGPVLYDNGLTDGINGHSSSAALNRWVLDDFIIPTGQTWEITDLEWTHVWQTALPGNGTGVELFFRQDDAGTPGAAVSSQVNVTSYTEVATGAVILDRPEAASSAVFDPVTLGSGTYWFQARLVGAVDTNSFWLGRTGVTGTGVWIDYPDDGFPLMSWGDAFPGSPSGDLNFQITGNRIVVPEPAALFTLVLGVVGVLSRRRGTRA